MERAAPLLACAENSGGLAKTAAPLSGYPNSGSPTGDACRSRLAPLPKQAPSPIAGRFVANKISLLLLPDTTDFMGLHLPAGLVPAHLATVKNIHGRRWDAEMNVWKVPYTKLTLRFWKSIFRACWTGHLNHRQIFRSGYRNCQYTHTLPKRLKHPQNTRRP